LFINGLIKDLLERIQKSDNRFMRVYIASVKENNLDIKFESLGDAYSRTKLCGLDPSLLEEDVDVLIELLRRSGTECIISDQIRLDTIYYFIIECEEDIMPSEQCKITKKWSLVIEILITIYDEIRSHYL
jgi:hypothetical protein